MSTLRWSCTAALLGVMLIAPAAAQQSARADTVIRPSRHPAIRVGKWVTFGLAAGAASYGVLANRDADERYTDLERICEAAPERCGPRNAGGQYTDAALEREYREIVRLDDRAKLSLIAAQAALLSSVVLFVLDLPRNGSGEDIPYKPPRLQVGYDAQARVELRVRLNAPGRR
ncbi:MAG: hypothetical protein WEE89_22145 [Gemmatimonadota bacterium]